MIFVERAIGGWIGSYAVACDQMRVGFLAQMLTISDERFQVLAYYFSHQSQVWCPQPDEVELLMSGGHTQILKAVDGVKIPRLRGALGKVGGRLKAREFYQTLSTSLKSECRQTGQAISALDKITLTELLKIRALPSNFRHPQLVGSLRNVREAEDLSNAIHALMASGVSPCSLQAALFRTSTFQSRRRSLERVARHAAFPSHPIPQTDWFSPISSGEELFRAARSMRNCMSRYIGPALAGRAFFSICRSDDETVVCYLRSPDSRSLLLADILGVENAPVTPSFVDQIRRHLELYGVLGAHPSADDRNFKSLERLLQNWFEYDDDMD